MGTSDIVRINQSKNRYFRLVLLWVGSIVGLGVDVRQVGVDVRGGIGNNRGFSFVVCGYHFIPSTLLFITLLFLTFPWLDGTVSGRGLVMM